MVSHENMSQNSPIVFGQMSKKLDDVVETKNEMVYYQVQYNIKYFNIKVFERDESSSFFSLQKHILSIINIPYISCYVTRVLILRIINIKWFKLFLV